MSFEHMNICLSVSPVFCLCLCSGEEVLLYFMAAFLSFVFKISIQSTFDLKRVPKNNHSDLYPHILYDIKPHVISSGQILVTTLKIAIVYFQAFQTPSLPTIQELLVP